MPQQYMAFHMAAQDLARYPEFQDDAQFQASICAKWGILLDCLTDDEATFLSRLVEEYYERS